MTCCNSFVLRGWVERATAYRTHMANRRADVKLLNLQNNMLVIIILGLGHGGVQRSRHDERD